MKTYDSVDELIKKFSNVDKKDLREQDLKLRRQRTILKYKNTEERIKEIEAKILKLQQERDNLLRKQRSRYQFLEESKTK